MARVILFGAYGVYVTRESGERHHAPHAHIKLRGDRVASVFLITLRYYHVSEPLPKGLMDQIREEQDRLLEVWSQLNDDE